MALRLSRPADAADNTSRTADRIDARAQARLVAGDLKGYRELFANAAAVEDPHRRYLARRTLFEQGLGAAATTPSKDVPQLFLTVARSAVELLEDEPREPVLLNYAGVALYELGSLDAAEALFRACRRLDDTVAHVEGNLQEIARRRRAGNAATNLPAPVRAALKPLADRAKSCAKRARPVEGLRLSLCMIVKDEEEMLPRCLAAVKPAVDEMIVVDTGSTDRTVEIAESFGARVLHHEWTGSFSDARNVSLEAATGDWIIYLDADEVLVEEDAERLRASPAASGARRSPSSRPTTPATSRTARRSPTTPCACSATAPSTASRAACTSRWPTRCRATSPSGSSTPSCGSSTTATSASCATRRTSRGATSSCSHQQVAEGQESAFQSFNLGSEYLALGEIQTAIEHFEKSWRMLETDPGRTVYPFVPTLANRFVTALRELGELDAADRKADEALELFPGYTDLVFQQAWIARARGDDAGARALFERCLEMGDAPSRYSSVVGCGTYLALIGLAQMSPSAEAEALLTRCIDEHPTFLGAVHPLAVAMLASGREPAAVVAKIESCVATLSPTVRFMLGTALYEAGAADAAEAQFRAVLDQQPGSVPARVALAEALLSQARYEDAAAEASKVGEGEPAAGAARRTEVFGLLVSGELDDAARVLDSSGSQLPAGEAALFGAWLAAARGGALPSTLPGESAQMLVTSLEALLRVREVDSFGLLVPLVERVGLSPRDRRELLASMYMRRGYLESAADEWISVIQELGPDAPALTGLALVAAAKEMPDDALVFAREASQLDPGYAAASRLVTRLEIAA